MSDWLYAEHSGTAFLIGRQPDGIFLYEIQPSGEMGDTWHPSVEEAQQQANFQVGSTVGPWRAVSAEFANTVRKGTRLPGT